MAKRIAFAQQAREEVNAAARRYEAVRPELKREFHSAVSEALVRMVRLSRHLGEPPLVDAGLGIERVFVDRFPFAIYFIELPDRFRVLAVSHGRRQPFYWRNRVPG